MAPRPWETIVIGGGAAGLSAALVLGRARRRTLVLDAGGQSNLPAHAIGGLLGQDGTSPAQLYAAGREQLAELDSVELRDAEASEVRPEGEGFVVETPDGLESAQTLILATGMRYELPEIPGIAELWGDTVFHCPFCHGWEMRDRRVVVLGGEKGEHMMGLLRGWTEDASLMDPGEVASVRAEDGKLAAVVRPDGTEVPADGLLIATDLVERSGIPDQLGLERTEAGLVSVDDLGRTSLPGVYAAGDLAVAPQQVVIAMASGHLAGAMVVRELMMGRGGGG